MLLDLITKNHIGLSWYHKRNQQQVNIKSYSSLDDRLRNNNNIRFYDIYIADLNAYELHFQV